MDETTAPVLDPGRGRTKTGYLWARARDDRGWGGADPPGVVFFYAPDRGGQNAEAFLRGFDGTLQLDGYTGYNRRTRATRKGGDPIRVAHFWAHARRKLKEVFDRDESEIAAEGLCRIAAFYAVEADIRGIDPGQRRSAGRPEPRPSSRPSATGCRRNVCASRQSRASAESSPTSIATGTGCRPSFMMAASRSTPTRSRISCARLP
jgi:hypothetical protein